MERKMRPVPQHQLECMLAQWQFNNRLSLSSAEMKMSPILWDWLVRVEGVICVDQQMMVTGVRFVDTGRRNPHAGETKLHLKRIGDGVAILRADDIDRGVGRGISASAMPRPPIVKMTRSWGRLRAKKSMVSVSPGCGGAPCSAACIMASLPKMPMTRTRLLATLGFAFFGQTPPVLRCCFAPSRRDNFERRLTHHIAKRRRRGPRSRVRTPSLVAICHLSLRPERTHSMVQGRRSLQQVGS